MRLPGCFKAFKTSGHLVTHKRLHTSEKPYRCDHPGCSAAFARSHHLGKHAKAFHSPEGQARQKKQEQRVAAALTVADILYKREHAVGFHCLESAGRMAFIDFVMDWINGKVVFLEVDEDQHKGYGVSCDVKRMACVLEALSLGGNTLPVVFLRYNPHAFTVDERRVKKLKTVREAALIALLRDPTSAVFTDTRPVVVQYMYYDTREGVAAVTSDPEYNQYFAGCCLPAIV